MRRIGIFRFNHEMRKYLAIISAVAVTIAGAYSGDAQTELLQDVSFYNGFRALMSCNQWEHYDASGQVSWGECRNYANLYLAGYGYYVHAWPDTDPARPCVSRDPSSGTPLDANGNPCSEYNKFWNLNEGVHTEAVGHSGWNPTAPVPIDTRPYWAEAPMPMLATGIDLAVHRIEVNATGGRGQYPNAPFIWLQNHNGAGDAVRTIETDPTPCDPPGSAHCGSVTIDADTAKEIVNHAIGQRPEYQRDTWPHFLLEQNFKTPIGIGTYSSVVLTVDLAVWPAEIQLPNPVWSEAASFVTYNISFLLRKHSDPTQMVWLQYSPYSISTNPPPNDHPAYAAAWTSDGMGNSLYRGDDSCLVAGSGPNFGDPPSGGSGARRFQIDVTRLFAQANSAGAQLGAYTQWDLFQVAMGYEVVGGAHIKAKITYVSLLGYP